GAVPNPLRRVSRRFGLPGFRFPRRMGADLPSRSARRLGAHRGPGPGAGRQRGDRPTDSRRGGRPARPGIPGQAGDRPQLCDGQHVRLQRLRAIWGRQTQDDPAIAAYRNRWIDALMADGQIEAVVALGALADHAWSVWRATSAGEGAHVAY